MAVQARERLLAAAITLGQREGWTHLTVADVLDESGVARRSLYSHFPGGVADLTVEAVRVSADWISAVVDQACRAPSLEALDAFVGHWTAMLEGADFTLGCPVLAAVTGRPQDAEATAVAARALVRWEESIAAALVRDGAGAEHAARLGTLLVAGVEGAVVQCLAARSTRPLEVVRDLLADLVGEAAPRARGVD